MFTSTTVADGYVWGFPCAGPVTSYFGARDIPQHSAGHSGVDIGVAEGTPVHSPAAGTVLDVFTIGVGADDWEAVFGNSVIVSYGDYVCLFAHLDRSVVYEGQEVAVGDLLGYSGATGDVNGPHLHWGMAPAQNRYLQREHAAGLLDPLSFVAPAPAPIPLRSLAERTLDDIYELVMAERAARSSGS